MSLDYYRTPTAMSDPGARAALFDRLPGDVGALAQVVQGLLMHEHIAPIYGLALDAAQHEQAHTRSVEKIVDSIVARDTRPLSTARAAGDRQVGVCRHFTLMHVAMLRRHGIPARARCGFAAYFQEGRFLDHWVSESWDGARWKLADAQLDARQRETFKVPFDPLDVPRDQFLVAGDAWRLCRSGEADASAFGILDMHGLWFIAANIVRDIAALNKREMLPWDCWAPMPLPNTDVDCTLFDRLARLSADPDAHTEELHAAYRGTLTVPATVMNAVHNRPEVV